ncbi:MAG: AAA family ATPase [Rectinema sp.]|nr:AAA family ATPase [Rectinema sp.]
MFGGYELEEWMRQASVLKKPWGEMLQDIQKQKVAYVVTENPVAVFFSKEDYEKGEIGYLTLWPVGLPSDQMIAELYRATAETTVMVVGTRPPSISTLQSLVSLLFLLIIALFLWQYAPLLRGVGQHISREESSTTFADVAGIDEVRQEVAEIVDYLRSPQAYRRVGARPPRGVLLVGPPGTGKTLLARAVAGEAGVPFIAVSGSDFVELFVGLGARRVRNLFEHAKLWSPCVIFIDEIDAVGRRRGPDGAGHSEMEQTLNALLTCMDGISPTQDIVVLAATNRFEILDPALVRPGRFDRRLHVGLPDVRGRVDILRVHARRIVLDANVDLQEIAKLTPGFSGADLANLVNEAALLAARGRRPAVLHADFLAARERLLLGQERRIALTAAERERIAMHEAGHAVVHAVLHHGGDLPAKVSIVPRGQSLGMTVTMPVERWLLTASMIRDRICILLAGRACERLLLGDVSSGSKDDIRQAVHLAKSLVVDVGVSQRGILCYVPEEHLCAPDLLREIELVLATEEQRAEHILTEHTAAVKRIVEVLLRDETMSGGVIADILRDTPVTAPRQGANG